MASSDTGEHAPLLSSGRRSGAAAGHGTIPGAEPGREASPDAPLLGPSAASSSSSSDEEGFPRKNLIAVILYIAVLTIYAAASVIEDLPLNSIIEEAICRSLHPGLSSDECGANKDVQNELALLRGWLITIELLPSILTAIPYGFLADKYGRKLILCVCLYALVVQEGLMVWICWRSDLFPIRLMWAAAAFSFVGGGPVVANSLLFAILSDLSPAKYRSTVFFYLGASLYAAQIMCSSFAATLMKIDPWRTVVVGLALYAPAIVLSFCLPETIPKNDLQTAADADSGPGSDTTTTAAAAAPGQGRASPSSPSPPSFVGVVANALHGLVQSVAFFIGANRHVALLLSTLVTTSLGKNAQELLLQFARRRYGWSWAQAGYLVTVKAFVVMLLLLVLLPGAGALLTKYVSGERRRHEHDRHHHSQPLSPLQRDIWLARGSCVLLVIGALMIGLSLTSAAMVAGLVVYTLGCGYNTLVRSILPSVVEPHHVGIIFNTAGILENIGSIISGPLLAAVFRVGLSLDGIWIGLPFIGAAVLFFTALVTVVFVRVQNKVPEEEDGSRE